MLEHKLSTKLRNNYNGVVENLVAKYKMNDNEVDLYEITIDEFDILDLLSDKLLDKYIQEILEFEFKRRKCLNCDD